MATVREINDWSAVEKLRPLWDVLLTQTPAASFFQSLQWLTVYWRYFGAGQTLRFLVVGFPNKSGGILPLVTRREWTRAGWIRVLTYPLQDWGTFYGPIGPDPEAVLRAGLDYLRDRPRDWDLLELRWVDPEIDCEATLRAMEAAGFETHASVWAQCPRVELFGDWNDYWASRASHWRTNVRSSEKKLAARGRVEYIRYRPEGGAAGGSGPEGDPRWDLFEACERIARDSWQGESQTGTTLTHESIRPFLRDVHEAAARSGALDLNLLTLDSEPIAFNYAYHYRGNVFGLRTGFCDTPRAAGAGTVLQKRMIEDSFARRDVVYDLGANYLSSKRPWQTTVTPALRYTHYPRWALRPKALQLKRWLTDWWQEPSPTAQAHAVR